jgi:radical SAM superfamily enzyme YgiQ (UPF0313 family)
MSIGGGALMANIIFINLSVKTYMQNWVEETMGYNPSLGLIYLGTFLELHGYNVKVLDLIYERIDINEIIDIIHEQKPLMIGISVYTENYKECINLAKNIKFLCGDVKIVFGGPHATLSPESIVKTKYVDFVTMKEGESTTLELVEAIRSNEKLVRFDDIQGIAFKRGKKIVKNKYRKTMVNLDLIPIPKRELVKINNYNKIVNITTSRGCTANCIYCAATSLSGASYRVRNIKNVFLEIIMLKALLKGNLQEIYFVDDTFTGIKGRVNEFIDLMVKFKPDIKWSCESRVNVMNESLLEKMANSGCVSIQYGIESGNQAVLDKIRKNINLEHAKDIIKATNKFGMEVCLSFMIGHYCDTNETMEDTYLFIRDICNRYNNIKVGVGFNTPFPGTWQFSHKDEIGLNIIESDYSNFTLLQPVVETVNFSKKDQLEAYMKIKEFIYN